MTDEDFKAYFEHFGEIQDAVVGRWFGRYAFELLCPARTGSDAAKCEFSSSPLKIQVCNEHIARSRWLFNTNINQV